MLSLYNKVRPLNSPPPKPQLRLILFKSNNRNISKEGESQLIWFNVSIKLNLELYKESLGEMGGIGKIGEIVKIVEMVEMDIMEYYI